MDESRISSAAKEIGGKVQGVAGELETRSKGKVNEFEDDAEKLYGQAKDAVRDVADRAGVLAHDAISRGHERFPEAEHTYRQGGDAIERYARESPLAMAAMSGAIGYILALVIHSRR